jgi:hypothetical protein
MRTKLVAGTALAGGLLMSTFVWQSAQATSAPDMKGAFGNAGTLTLVAHNGGGGEPGGGAGNGHAGLGGNGDGGRLAARGGGDIGDHDHISGGGNGDRGAQKGKDMSGDHNYSTRHFNDGQAMRDHDDRHFSSRDHDHDHFNRHRVFRNGVWVWAYGPDYYAGNDDCAWLLNRAEVTDSPYWWRRYNLCIGYY